MLLKFKDFLNELNDRNDWVDISKSLKYWRQVLGRAPLQTQYALKVLDTIEKKQKGIASPAQLDVLRRYRDGDFNYPKKN